MDEKVRGFCDRCNQPTHNITTMSRFNTETICIPCRDFEKTHPEYKKAADAELAECKSGNMNYEGIGLPNDFLELLSKHLEVVKKEVKNNGGVPPKNRIDEINDLLNN